MHGLIGLGTIVNTAAVVAGGGIGLLLKQGIKASLQESLLKALGVSTLFIGIAGTLQQLLIIDGAALKTAGTMLMIFSLIIGTLIGEYIDIERHLEKMGVLLRRLLHADKNSPFTDAFVTVTLVICVGAMAIIGSIQDGLSGDYDLLFTKAILDGVICMVFASAMGAGVIAAALPLFIYQGSITLAAGFIAPYLTDALIGDICCVGNVLITLIGVNLLFDKVMHVRVGNMLPSLLVPILYHMFF